ncbi:MAG: trehalose-6-phosphate synthase [Firmicutes bacterium]|nr:trehalose-6-phosphate synthase [Alicyclobacillaceae bacterium]MCL6497066.1 trehalose-6-phosphate synthase [Bacillota bacterium]
MLRLEMPPLVVVTSREPYVDEHTKFGIRTVQKAGGVVSALDPLMQTLGGHWVAWGSGSADRDTLRDGVRWVPPDRPRYRLHRVFLAPEEVEGFYAEYSNQGLWPLCHLLIERAQFAERAWARYAAVNQRFARTAADRAPKDAWVFSHDYQLALFPSTLRALRPDVTIAHFWHIPWPPARVFQLVPQHRALLQGLLGADVLGFQTPADAEQFLATVAALTPAGVDFAQGQVQWQGRTVRVRAFPIAVDTAGIQALVQSPRVERLSLRLRRRLDRRGHQLVVAVERADYTKGCLRRLAAWDAFLTRYPGWRDRVTFLQVLVPSRTEVPEYRQLFARLMRQSRAFNRRWPRQGSPLLLTIPREVDRPRLMALFRAADVVVIHSLLDGMNLVAKEFVAAQVERRGVLLLSRSAGAAQELGGALPIHPLDPEGTADALATALNMDRAERARRMADMQRHLTENDLEGWIDAILATLYEVALNRVVKVASS